VAVLVLQVLAVPPIWAKSDTAGCREARLSVKSGAGRTRTAAAIRLKESCIASLAAGPRAAGTAGKQLRLAETRVVIFSDTQQPADLDDKATLYFSNLDSENYGSYSWAYVNNTGAALTNVKALALLDADIDVALNGYANEYAVFISQALPPSAPSGSTAASSWEIDEPGYVFGNIYQHLYNGTLDNTNAVPQSAPDDVSMALGFTVGQLNPGDKVTITLYVSKSNIGGLKQTDPNSPLDIYYNGAAQVSQSGPIIPAPSSLILVISGMMAAAGIEWMRRRRLQAGEGGRI
jgi:hypothetical protein